MSINNESNINLIIKNNSTQNLCLSSNNKNNSSNFLSQLPTTLKTARHQSSESKIYSEKKDTNNIGIKNINYINNSNNICSKNTNLENKPKNYIKNEDNDNHNSSLSNQNLAIYNKKDSKYKKLLNENDKNNSSKRQKIESNPPKNMNNYKIKLCENYEIKIPKQISSNNSKIGVTARSDPGNIVVKKNLKIGTQNSKNSPNNNNKKNIISKTSKSNNNKNEYVKYVNNDKYNLNGNILNMTQKYKQLKYFIPQSKSFTKMERKNLGIRQTSSSSTNIFNNNICNQNMKGNNNFNYNNYKNFNKKKQLTVLTKNNDNTFKNNNKNYNDNNMNSFGIENLSTSPNANHHSQEHYVNNSKNNQVQKNSLSGNNTYQGNKGKNKSNGGNSSNNTSCSNINTRKKENSNEKKNIYFMKPTHQRKKTSNGKNYKGSPSYKENTTNQSSFVSKTRKDIYFKNTLDSTFLSDIFNRNVDNPEELHFLYIKILQNGKEISKKFENVNT